MTGQDEAGVFIYHKNHTENSFEIYHDENFTPMDEVYDEFIWKVKLNKCSAFSDTKIRRIILKTIDNGPCPGYMEEYINKDWNLGLRTKSSILTPKLIYINFTFSHMA